MTLFEKLAKATKDLDDYLRFRDFRQHRTVGGRLDHRFGIRRHTLPALVLPSLLCGLLVLADPSWLRCALAAVTALATFAIITVLMIRSDRKNWPLWADLAVQAVPVLTTASVVWLLGTETYRSDGIYRHLFVPLTASLCIALLLASALVDIMFRRLRDVSNYDDCLGETELFAGGGPAPVVTWGTISTSFLMVVFRSPLALLTMPAIAALVARPGWIALSTGIVFAVCFLALFFAGLNERFGIMWSLMQAVFFKGGALIVSLIVIILAVARVAKVTYVTTVFDTAAWWIVGISLAFAYLLSWWYDYWANRLLSDQIISLIQPGVQGTASIEYPIDPDFVATSVVAEDRVLQIHGASRFIAIGRNSQNKERFQSYTMSDLIDVLAVAGAPGGRAIPTPIQVRGRMFNFHTLAGLLFVSMIFALGWRIHIGPQSPEVKVWRDPKPGVSLYTLLFDEARRKDDRPLIVVAASGGGTRAALYTAAVLEGIAKLGRSQDIVLGSGVSGGGAALAYFAAYRPSLVQGDAASWEKYFFQMKQAYIQDVLERSSEWRMITRGRLGSLLAESFFRHWELGDGKRAWLDNIDDIGLIFNTSLAGHFDRPKEAPPDKSLEEVEPPYRSERTKSSLAGGRLILTNLELPAGFTGKPLEEDVTHPLPVVVHSADLRVEYAAALNANFPPVFANAAIDKDDQTRYWVTDGGAVDNRGLEMLLYAIRDALKEANPAWLPRIHVIVADASAFSDRFSQDRGVSSMAGAGSHFASHLDTELKKDIEAVYQKQPERFQFSYVMMPERLRASGSFGTHWMLQSRIEVHHDRGKVKIDGEEMIKVLRMLHSPSQDLGLSAGGCQVLHWSREDSWHHNKWLEVVTALGGHDVEPTCGK